MAFLLNQILNISPNLQTDIYLKDFESLPYFFFYDIEGHQFRSYCTDVLPQSGGKIFLYSHLSVTAAYSLKSEQDWPVDFAKL